MQLFPSVPIFNISLPMGSYAAGPASIDFEWERKDYGLV